MHPPNFTFPGAGCTVKMPSGPAFTVLATVLAIGTMGCLALVLGALIAVAALLNLALSTLVELSTHLSLVYQHADSTGQLLVWLVGGYLLVKVSPLVVRSVARSLRSWRIS